MNGISVYFAIVLSVLCNLSIDIPLDYAEYLKKKLNEDNKSIPSNGLWVMSVLQLGLPLVL